MASFPTFADLWLEFTPQDEIQVITDDQSVNLRNSVTLSDNMKQNVQCTTRPLTHQEDRELKVFFKEIRGRGTFTLDLDYGSFKYSGTSVVPNSTFSTQGSHSVGDTIINLNQFPTAATLPTGSYIQFEEGGKVHQVISRASNTMTILPSLYKAVDASTFVRMTELKGTYRIDRGVPEAQQSFIYRTQYSFNMIEELPRVTS